MTSDLKRLRATLQARAEAGADADALLARVGPAYRRRRNRRIAGSTVAVVAVAVLVAMLVPRLLLDGFALPAPPMGPSVNVSMGRIGSDPQTVHFDVGSFPYPVSDTRWTVGRDVEQLTLRGTDFTVELILRPDSFTPTADPTTGTGPDTAQTTSAVVGGRPATVATARNDTRVTWQPATGISAELNVHGTLPVSKIVTFAGTLRLDRGHTCTLRLRPTTLPAGARIVGCSIEPASRGGELTIGDADGVITIRVPFAINPGVSPGPTVKTLANGWGYEELDPTGSIDDYTAWIRINDPYVEVAATGAYGMREVLEVANGLRRS